jgi:hypothetical protein
VEIELNIMKIEVGLQTEISFILEMKAICPIQDPVRICT